MLAFCRDGVGVEPPPLTAKIDGKAATICVCHGRPLLCVVSGIANRKERIISAALCRCAGQLVRLVGAEYFALLMRASVVLKNYCIWAGRFSNLCGILCEGHYISPFSANDSGAAMPPTIIWSSTFTSTSASASFSADVIVSSARLCFTSPDG